MFQCDKFSGSPYIHPAIIGCLLLKWHWAIGILLSLTPFCDGQVFRQLRCQHGKWCWCDLAEAVWVCDNSSTLFIMHRSDTSDTMVISYVWMYQLLSQLKGVKQNLVWLFKRWDVVCLQGLSIYEAIWRQFFQKWSHLYLQLRLL